MKVVKPHFYIVNPRKYDDLLFSVESGGRTCYKSEGLIVQGEAYVSHAEAFVQRLISMGHESVLEHSSIGIRFICDRGVSHELVRHRVGIGYSQESTRFANYANDKFGNEIACIDPVFWSEDDPMYAVWLDSMKRAEDSYLFMIENGATPQEARSVLPNSLKTEIVVTANIRAWRTVFKQRCASAAHPQMRQIMLGALFTLADIYPVFFKDLADSFRKERDNFMLKYGPESLAFYKGDLTLSNIMEIK